MVFWLIVCFAYSLNNLQKSQPTQLTTLKPNYEFKIKIWGKSVQGFMGHGQTSNRQTEQQRSQLSIDKNHRLRETPNQNDQSVFEHRYSNKGDNEYSR